MHMNLLGILVSAGMALQSAYYQTDTLSSSTSLAPLTTVSIYSLALFLITFSSEWLAWLYLYISVASSECPRTSTMMKL